jgi:hypothetical protein
VDIHPPAAHLRVHGRVVVEDCHQPKGGTPVTGSFWPILLKKSDFQIT